MLLKINQDEQRSTPEGFSKLAVNLEALLKAKNLNASKVAQKLGIPIMTVRRLLSGETTDPRISTLKLIADYLGVSVNSLVEDNYAALEKPAFQSRPFLVPILDWQTAEEWRTLQNLNAWPDWQPVAGYERDLINQNSFALRSRPSMYPRFPYGTIFIINPDMAPADGDIVLVKLNNGELTLRELIIDPPEWKFYPIVTGSVVLNYLAHEHKIVGVNVLTMLYNRNS
jgi:transcriptional regulator with XRE-family HTH domain